MRAERKWAFFTAGVAALSFAVDAAAQKHPLHIPGMPDVAVGGPRFEPRLPPGLASGHPGKGGLAGGFSISAPSGSRGESQSASVPGHGAMPEKANGGGPGNHGKGKGKGENEAPGDNVQSGAAAEMHAASKQRELHETPTCH